MDPREVGGHPYKAYAAVLEAGVLDCLLLDFLLVTQLECHGLNQDNEHGPDFDFSLTFQKFRYHDKFSLQAPRLVNLSGLECIARRLQMRWYLQMQWISSSGYYVKLLI